MKKLMNRLHALHNDEGGMEFIAVAVIVIGAVMVALVAKGLYDSISGGITKANGDLSGIFDGGGAAPVVKPGQGGGAQSPIGGMSNQTK